jgi:hypothetical protein
MKAKLLIRIAAGCMLFFALGHSAGHATRKNIDNPQAQEVLKAMTSFKFDQFGQMRSYDENYTGMSLNLIATLLMLTVLLWFLSKLAEQSPKATRQILLPVALCSFAFAVTGFLYFFLLPAFTCLIAGLLLATAIYKLYKTEKLT